MTRLSGVERYVLVLDLCLFHKAVAAASIRSFSLLICNLNVLIIDSISARFDKSGVSTSKAKNYMILSGVQGISIDTCLDHAILEVIGHRTSANPSCVVGLDHISVSTAHKDFPAHISRMIGCYLGQSRCENLLPADLNISIWVADYLGDMYYLSKCVDPDITLCIFQLSGDIHISQVLRVFHVRCSENGFGTIVCQTNEGGPYIAASKTHVVWRDMGMSTAKV